MLLFYVVMFLAIFLGLQYYRARSGRPEPDSGKNAPAAARHEEHNTAAIPGSTTPKPSHTGAPAMAPTIEASNHATTVVESPLYRVTFSNEGGVVTSWILKKYTNDAQTQKLDLVNRNAAKQYGYPLSLYTYDQGLTARLNSVLYKPSATGTLKAPATVSFIYSSGGLVVRKTFHFKDDYVLKTDITVTRSGHPVTSLLAWPSGFGNQEPLQQYANGFINTETGAKTGFHLFGGPNVNYYAPKKVFTGSTIHGPLDYAGVSDLYFGSIFLPQNPDNALMVTMHHAMNLAKNGKKAKVPVLGAAVGSTTGVIHDRLFVGPKSLDVLESVHTVNHYNLDGIVKYGWSGWIVKWMFLLLRFLYNHGIHNWGWAILVLTGIFYTAMVPTRLTMMKKSLAMMRIQPQMDAIRSKYKRYKATDPRRQEMNQEIMNLQKREGINMFAGCLPMLVQFPLLYGFWRMLEVAIALRHAHWLWIQDLSAPDPYHILPIFVIVTMFLVQFFTPSPGVDPKQQRMMAFVMPVFFGFLMWNLGAGVSLYYAGGNVISVVQQWAMNKSKLGQEMKELAATQKAKKLLKVT